MHINSTMTKIAEQKASELKNGGCYGEPVRSPAEKQAMDQIKQVSELATNLGRKTLGLFSGLWNGGGQNFTGFKM